MRRKSEPQQKNDKGRTARRSWVLLCAIFPLIYMIFWHKSNWSYPRGDEADFAEVSQRIYLAFLHGGWTEYCHAFYLVRSWKPVLHPAIGSLALLLTGGKMLAALASSACAYYFVFLCYVALTLRRSLRLLPASLGTLIIGFLPWVIDSASSNLLELPMIACMMGLVFHLMALRDEHSVRHGLWSGLWLGLGLCIRPAEMMLLFVVPIFLAAAEALNRRKLQPRDLLTFAAATTPFLSFFFWCAIRRLSDPSHLWIWAGYSLFPYVLWITAARRLKLTPWFVALSGLTSILVVVWYLPTAWGLVSWIYEGSFSAVARLTGGRSGMTATTFVVRLFSELGGPTLKLLLITAILRIGFSEMAAWRKRKSQSLPILHATGLTAITFAILVGSAAHNADLRYYCGAFSLAFLMCATAALAEGRRYLLRLGCGSIILGLLLTSRVTADYCPERAEPWMHRFSGHLFGPLKRYRYRDPGVDLFKELARYVPGNRTAIQINTVPLACHGDVEWTMDPWMLTILAREYGHANWMFYRINSFGRSPEEQYKELAENNQYTLVGPMEGCEALKDGSNPVSVLGQGLLDLHTKGELQRIRLVPVGIIEARSRDSSKGRLLLLKTM